MSCSYELGTFLFCSIRDILFSFCLSYVCWSVVRESSKQYSVAHQNCSRAQILIYIVLSVPLLMYAGGWLAGMCHKFVGDTANFIDTERVQCLLNRRETTPYVTSNITLIRNQLNIVIVGV